MIFNVAMSFHLKINFAIEEKHEAFFTGGNAQITQDGSVLFCGCGNKARALGISSGKLIGTFGETEDEEITSFVLSPNDEVLVLATQNLLLRQWDWRNNTLTRSWKAIHTGPIRCMTFDLTSTLLVTGSSDSTIKVWDVVRKYCTHNLRGHTGVIRTLSFHPDSERLELYSGAEDGKIRVWDLTASSCSHVLDTHYSVVTCLAFTPDGHTLLSSGRDSIIAVWDTDSYKLEKTIPVFETVESLFLLPEDKAFPSLGKAEDGLFAVTAGSKGFLRVWDVGKSKCIHNQEEIIPTSTAEEEEQEQIITQALYNVTSSTITVLTHDHNIFQFADEDFALKKQFAGYNDEVLDVQFLGQGDTHLGVITNSNQVKVFEVATWTCQILYGHTDIVLCLHADKSSQQFVTSSKDNTIRLWRLDSDSSQVTCIAIGYGHTHAVGCVTFSKLSCGFVVSGSQDCTLKLWSVAGGPDSPVTLQARITEKAHDKDINSVTVAPNDKLIASGSQDRTVKLWDSESLSLLGVMRGHKRGVWCVQFSPVDQCVASSSGDGTIKIWALSDFTCVKTFEDHDSSVLKVLFLSRGMQLLSSGSDGLLKLWTIKNNECVQTFDQHEDKVWALAVSRSQNRIVTGAGDSKIIIWKDVTESELDDQKKTQEEFILQEQELSNLIQQKKYLKAIRLAITLDQPFRLLTILKKILESASGESDLESALSKLRPDQIGSVLGFAAKWNTNSRNCHVAQLVVMVILRSVPLDELVTYPNIKSTVEGLLPYTERHYQRLSRLGQQAMFVDYTWHSMRDVASTSSRLGPAEEAVPGPVFVPYVPPQKRAAPIPAPQPSTHRDLGLLIRQRVQQLNQQKQHGDDQTESSADKRQISTDADKSPGSPHAGSHTEITKDSGGASDDNTDIPLNESPKKKKKVQKTKPLSESNAKLNTSKSKLKSLKKGRHLQESFQKGKKKIRKKNG